MDTISQSLITQIKSIKTLFISAFVAISLLFAGILYYSLVSYKDILQLREKALRIHQLHGQITHLDEILTMSALMAAATGDIQWKIRYNVNEPRLRMAINEMVRLTPQLNFGLTAEQTKNTNNQLVNMERKAFQLIDEGLMYEAQAILFGPEYEKFKNVYAQGMQDQAHEIKGYLKSILKNVEKQRRVFILVFTGILSIIILIGGIVYKIVTRWQEELIKKNEEIKKANFKLLQAEKLASIGQLAAGIAHEINNPIGFVSNNVYILEGYLKAYYKLLILIEDLNIAVKNNEEGNISSLYKELIKIEEEANLKYIKEDLGSLLGETKIGLERVGEIVKDLKLFARNDRDKVKHIKVEEIIDSILNIVRIEIKYKAEIIKEYGETEKLKCVPQKIGQVFINLLMNAGQSIDKKGRITIRTFQKDGFVFVQIADSGCGMDEAKLARIFEPFYTTKLVHKGTGLGLSISYEIVQRHGGDILVDSKEGEGTVFTISLPIRKV